MRRFIRDIPIVMTLDRVDNSQGHLQSNVKPSCIRCNSIRGNMPFDAWIVVAEGVKKATELKLFGTWTGNWKYKDTIRIDNNDV